MKCPACCSEIDDRSYRCKQCRRICSYRRLCWRYRYFVLMILALVGYWAGSMLFRGGFSAGYDRLPEGAVVSDSMTRAWLGLKDADWFCEEPHRKGQLLHLRHRVFQAK